MAVYGASICVVFRSASIKVLPAYVHKVVVLYGVFDKCLELRDVALSMTLIAIREDASRTRSSS